jgi:hypothetical protein
MASRGPRRTTSLPPPRVHPSSFFSNSKENFMYKRFQEKNKLKLKKVMGKRCLGKKLQENFNKTNVEKYF